jgi:hypothetical protein
MRGCCAAKMKDRMNVNGKSVHPTFICNFVETSRYCSACRVHKNIEAAEFLDDLVYETTACSGVGNIAFQKSRCGGLRSYTESLRIGLGFVL